LCAAPENREHCFSTSRFQSTKRPELAFRALLSEDRTEGLELARA
jgi:hypothetical protein